LNSANYHISSQSFLLKFPRSDGINCDFMRWNLDGHFAVFDQNSALTSPYKCGDLYTFVTQPELWDTT